MAMHLPNASVLVYASSFNEAVSQAFSQAQFDSGSVVDRRGGFGRV